ncbi:thioredoxin family protein [Staphylococcus lugdunensis]|uniref:thioredoxin family protein n=1 Tax=Staphylococcus lugdunensis TaxID=28035 RepID=UPI001F4C8A05|nr:thioredoxin family protein [Staphylococcus lugdunensis]MCH8646886.1 thioredoxin family protein [Staphylococcus lugdunensis]
MKKLIITFVSVLIIIVIGLTLYSKLFKVEKPLYTKINTQQLKKKINDNEKFVVYLYQDNCSGCKRMKPIINEYIRKNKDKVFAIDVNKSENIDYLSNKIKLEKTPTFIFYENGREKERIVGQMSEEEIKKKLK